MCQSLGATGLLEKTLPGDALLGAFAGIACIGIAAAFLQNAARHLDVTADAHDAAEGTSLLRDDRRRGAGYLRRAVFSRQDDAYRERLAAAVLVALTSAAFSIWHVGTPAYLPHTFVLGLIFGILTVGTGRLAHAIVAHTVANAGTRLLFLCGYNAADQ